MDFEKTENVVDAERMLKRVATECLNGIESLPGQQANRVLVNNQPSELNSQFQNFNRNIVIRNYYTLLNQASTFETLATISENPTVADVQCHERLKHNSEDLEKSFKSFCTRNMNYKILLNLLKETEEELLAVKTEIDCGDMEDDDAELSILNRMFQQVKKDVNFVLGELIPESKDAIKEFLSNLEKYRNEWYRINDETEICVVMMLLNANVIVQHPELKDHFKLAPMCDG